MRAKEATHRVPGPTNVTDNSQKSPFTSTLATKSKALTEDRAKQRNSRAKRFRNCPSLRRKNAIVATNNEQTMTNTASEKTATEGTMGGAGGIIGSLEGTGLGESAYD